MTRSCVFNRPVNVELLTATTLVTSTQPRSSLAGKSHCHFDQQTAVGDSTMTRQQLMRFTKLCGLLLLLASIACCLGSWWQWYVATHEFWRLKNDRPGVFPDKITPEERQELVSLESKLREAGHVTDESGMTGIQLAEQAKELLALHDTMAAVVDRKNVADSRLYSRVGAGAVGFLIGAAILLCCRTRNRLRVERL
jgi:hypothetical protein